MRILLVALPLLFGAACGDDKAKPQDAGIDAAPDAGCVDITSVANPSNEQIINACTPPTVQKVFKDTRPPLLNEDGSLPALPP